MDVLLGPVLTFRGNELDTWKVSALVALDRKGKAKPPILAWSLKKQVGAGATLADAAVIHSFTSASKAQAQVVRFDLEVAQTDSEQQIFYRVGAGNTYSFVVPARQTSPRMAYASCNGFSDLKAMKKIGDQNALWKDVLHKHRAAPYNLLLMGGDQIYSDSMWTRVPELEAWSALPWPERLKARFEPLRALVEEFFFRTYIDRWKQPEVAAVMACVPTMMMWDDHDIFDGWGSYPDDQRESAVYRGIFEVASIYFRVFQLGIAPGESRPGNIPGQDHFSFGHKVGDIAVLALDLRSERTEKQVMSDTSWNAAAQWMEGLSGCTHLLLLSSIPVVHPDFGLVDKLLGILPGRQELEDDLKDHWHTLAHRKERLRLIHRLFTFSASKQCRVTILSGDVHVAAVGILESQRSDGPRNSNVINQLTSSGIVHPAPPGIVLYFLESVADQIETVDRGITAEMAEFPATSHRFIGTRNWLSLEPDPEKTLWANWYVEDGEQPYTKAVHRVAQ